MATKYPFNVIESIYGAPYDVPFIADEKETTVAVEIDTKGALKNFFQRAILVNPYKNICYNNNEVMLPSNRQAETNI